MDRAEVKVQMLGGFSISCGKVYCMYDRSYKTWELTAYLIANHGRMVPRQELLPLFADGGRHTDPNRVLRDTVLRARHALHPISEAIGQELIITKGDCRGWNTNVPTRLDAEEFESLCMAGRDAAEDTGRLERFRRALSLYQGDLLDAFSSESWVGSLSAHYQELWLETIEQTLSLLREGNEYAEMTELCRRALKLCPYNEALHRGWMRGLMRQRKYEEAADVYRDLYDLLSDELGIAPEKETQELYQEILRHTGDLCLAPEAIRDALREAAHPTGALICDYNDFKFFYQAEARAAGRRGDAVHVGLLSVVGKKGEALSDRKLGNAMRKLHTQIKETLRVGDIAACCSASQYIVLLVQSNLENSRMVCERVSDAFHRANPNSLAMVRCTVLPLEPAGMAAERGAKLAQGF